jgi:NADH dehydrogenase/NADH:ubiquinone oxidoreductase subunit G
MKIIIDGKTCEAQAGQYLLEIAGQNGIEIPALCHHRALSGQACCRLCIVEIEGKGGWRSVIVSCVYPIKEEITVYTRSEKIIRLRQSILALLKTSAPEAEGALPAYYLEYGVSNELPSSDEKKDKKCILCGLCVKACGELGNSAIQAVMRGVYKTVAPPFNEPPLDCIGCAACARVCPTNAVEYSDDYDSRTIWGKTFALTKCSDCGKPFATPDELEWLKKKLLDTELNLAYCPACKRRITVRA